MNARLTTRCLRRALPALAFLSAGCGGIAPPGEGTGLKTPIYVGEVSTVNRAGNSVLIDVRGAAPRPEPGTALTAISRKGEGVRLKVTAEQKRGSITAEIVSGAAAAGEAVYR